MQVERRFNLGGTAIAHQALVSGGIDVYVEYSGTALTAIFNLPPSTDCDAVLDASARSRYARARRHACCRALASTTPSRSWSAPTLAREQGLGDDRAISTRLAPTLTAGFGYEFLERPDGFTGLSAAYGLRFAGRRA